MMTLRVGLERLQQLFDALTEEGQVVRTHVYRVMDGNDAYGTLSRIDEQRKSDNKYILLDLPTKDCELLLQKEVSIRITIRYAAPMAVTVCGCPAISRQDFVVIS